MSSIDDIARVVGRLYLDTQLTIDELARENRRLKQQLEQLEKKAPKPKAV